MSLAPIPPRQYFWIRYRLKTTSAGNTGWLVLFLATAGFVLWQNTQIAVLWDLGYLLDTSWRFAIGQTPYRDFPLVHPPLTFAIQSILIRLMGRQYWLQIAYVALAGGLATVLTWRILHLVLGARRWLCFILAVPLCVLGVYSVYPHPIYDCDCAIALLAAIYGLLRLDNRDLETATRGRIIAWSLLAGCVSTLPIFFKQNMGLPFLAALIVGILLQIAATFFSREQASTTERKIMTWLLGGVAISLFAESIILQVSVGIGSYLHWTVQFAAERRLPGLGPLVDIYRDPSLLWTLPLLLVGWVLLRMPFADRLWLRLIGMCSLAAPFLTTLIAFLAASDTDDKADCLLALWPLILTSTGIVASIELRKGIRLRSLMPFCVIVAINGTFLSQQLWGSTYAIWPLLVVLIALVLQTISQERLRETTVLAAVIAATLLVCGSFYAASHIRLNYIYQPDGAIQNATLPAMRGMAAPGPYIADFEELVRFAGQNIPVKDGILLLPGEEPFYFAIGRIPQFPVLLFDRTTDPYSAAELTEEARRRGIQWVIIKTRLQSNEDPLPEADETRRLVAQEFRLYRKLSGYDVFLRR